MPANLTVLDEIAAAAQEEPASVLGGVSSLWREILEVRSSSQKLQDFEELLAGSGRRLYGTGPLSTADAAPELLQRMGAYLPKDLSAVAAVPSVGRPPMVDINGARVSIPHLFKLRTYFILQEAFAKTGRGFSDLRYAEIGAGWGALASILHEQRVVRSFVDIDLRENLENAAHYLTESFPTRDQVVLREGREDDPKAALRFALPGYAHRIEGPFDLIVNEASLAEMPSPTAMAYLGWIERNLAEDGVFFWQNGRARNQHAELPQRMTSYDLARFDPIIVAPHRGRAGVFHDTALAIACRRRPPGKKPALDFNRYYDVLVQAADIGVTDELLEIYETLPSGAVSTDFVAVASALDVFFETGARQGLRALVQQGAPDVAAALGYVLGVDDYAHGVRARARLAMQRYLREGRSPVALAFAASICAAEGWRVEGADPVAFLQARPSSETHWPQAIRQAGFERKQLVAGLRGRLSYPNATRRRALIGRLGRIF